ncbi:MAG: 2-C-methyl-D-erythritol 4-phosphate cytidylyltransferase [Candidatus Omnitrophota bacterium]
MYITAIVLAAGKGLRIKSKISKPLIKIDSKPVIAYSLGILNKHPLIKDIIVVTNTSNAAGIKQIKQKYRISKIKAFVLGGRQRKDSVYNGLSVVNLKSDFILIHDSARPFINSRCVSKVIEQAKTTGAAILGVPVKATIKQVHRSSSIVHRRFIVKKTLDRSNLWEIQTPQVFRKDLILEAYKKFGDLEATDDAFLIEKLGVKVQVVMGSYDNIKITTQEDLVLVEALAKNLKL